MMKRIALLACLLVCCLTGAVKAAEVDALLACPDLRPGIALLVGCGDPARALALHQGGFVLVHAVENDTAKVEAFRAAALAAGVHGAVTAERVTLQRLPLANDLANLVFIDNLPQRQGEGLTLQEALRVLAPFGSLVLGGADEATLRTDLAAAGLAEAPLQKLGSWYRVIKPYPAEMDDWPMQLHDAATTNQSHDTLVGPLTGVRWIQAAHRPDNKMPMTDIVVGNGRIFYARHAPGAELFGGLPSKPGFQHTLEARDAFNGLLLWQRPIWCPPLESLSARRSAFIAVDGDRVFATLTEHGPVCALDAATGKLLRTFSPGDIAIFAHKLVLREGNDRFVVLDPASGAQLLVMGANGSYYDAPFLLADGKLLVTESGEAERPHTGGIFAIKEPPARGTLVCYDINTGKRLWARPNIGNGFLFWCQRGLIVTRAGSSMHGFSLADGTHNWVATMGTKLFAWPACFYQGDNLWGYGDASWYFAYDPATGKRLHADSGRAKEFGRCNPDRATGKYVLGPEFEVWDLPAGQMWNCCFARADCTIGWIPANGLGYNGYTPDCCGCSNGIRGTFALSANEKPIYEISPQANDTSFVTGPAFGAVTLDKQPHDGEWSTFRHDPYRSAATTVDVPARLRPEWTAKLSAPLTAPVVAGGLVLLACMDECRVVALDAESGRQRWDYLAGGRIDSPPTFHQGLVLFGCRDGWLYCLAASDGRLVWRRRVAPEDRLISVRGRLESAWPVFGAVVMNGNTVYANAGRHGDGDGGIWLLAADAATGAVKRHVNIHGYPPYRTDSQLRLIEARDKIPDVYSEAALKKVDPKYLAGIGSSIANDVLISDGATLFLNAVGMDLASGEVSAIMRGKALYTYGTTLIAGPDLTRFEGTEQWSYEGNTDQPSWRTRAKGPSGFQIALDDHHLYRITSPRTLNVDSGSAAPRQGLDNGVASWQKQLAPNAQFYALMVAGDKLVAAARINNASGDAMYGEIHVYRAGDGAELGVSRLPAAPVWQGLAAVNGRLYVTCEDGSVTRLGPDCAPPVLAGAHLLPAGGDASFTVAFPKDATPDLPVVYTWHARLGGALAGEGTVTIATAGELALPVTLHFPVKAGTERCAGALTFRWTQAGRDMGETTVPLVAIVPGRKPTLAAAQLAVWDPAGSARAYLQQRGIAFTPVAGLEAVTPATRVLVVGENAVTPELARSLRWRELTRARLSILLLDQQATFGRDVLGIDTGGWGQAQTALNIVDSVHPACAGLTSADCSDWQPASCRKGYSGQEIRALIASPNDRTTALAEIPLDGGMLIACQLALGEQLAANPAAQRLFDNLLGYAAAFQPHALAVAIPAADPRNDQLFQSGLVFEQIADVPEAMRNGKYDRIIADASAPLLRQLLAERQTVKAYTDRGGWLMLWGLTPDGLADYNRLLGVQHLLRPFDLEHVELANTSDRMLYGLHAADLNITGDGYGFWGAHKTASDAYTAVVSLDDIAPYSTFPGPAYWKQTSTGLDRNPRNLVNGYTDAWQLSYVFNLDQGAPADIPITLPRVEKISGFQMSPGPYNRVSKIRLEFDHPKSKPLDIALDPNSDLLNASFPPRQASQVTLRFIDWEPSSKASIIGVNNLWLRVDNGDAYRAMVQPLANIGVLVKYRMGQGGIILNQFRIPAQDEIDARRAKDGKPALERIDLNLAEKRHVIGQMLRNLGVPFVTRAPLARSLSLAENNWLFPSGAVITRTVPFAAAEAYRFPMTVAWSCHVNGAVAGSGEQTFTTAADLPPSLKFTCPLPQVDDRASGVFDLYWKQNGKERFHAAWELTVLRGDAHPAPVFAAGALAVYDPAGSAVKRLTARGIAFTTLPDLTNIPPDARILLIGANALKADTADAPLWRDLTRRGVRIVVLEQAFPLTAKVLGHDVTARAWNGQTPQLTVPTHPLLADLQSADFAPNMGALATRGVYGVGKDAVHAIFSCEAGKAAVLAEFPADDGTIICSQMVLDANLDSSPVAQRLFDNLLRYANDVIPLQLKSALPPASPKADMLAATNLHALPAADPLAAMADPHASVVLMEAAPAALQSLLAAEGPRKAFFERGGWLVLWGLTPEGLPTFNQLVGVPHLYRAFEDEQVNPRPGQLLLNGLSADDLNFPLPRDGVNFPAAAAWQGAVDLDDLAPFCRMPGADHFGDANALPYLDHWPRRMLQGFVAPDHWRKTFLIVNVPQGKTVTWDMQVPRASASTAARW